jgi:hypothetical protein
MGVIMPLSLTKRKQVNHPMGDPFFVQRSQNLATPLNGKPKCRLRESRELISIHQLRVAGLDSTPTGCSSSDR